MANTLNSTDRLLAGVPVIETQHERDIAALQKAVKELRQEIADLRADMDRSSMNRVYGRN